MPLTPVGSTFRINTQTANSQSNSDIAALPNKRFATVWYDIGSNAGDIKAQFLEPDGTLVGGEVTVNRRTEGGQENPDITVLSSCIIVVTWQDFVPGTNYDIKFNFFIPNSQSPGAPSPADVVVTNAAGNQVTPAVVASPNGGFDVVWTNQATGAIEGKALSASFGAGQIVQITSGINSSAVDPAFASGPNRYAFVFEDPNANFSSNDGIFAANSTSWPTSPLAVNRIDPGTALNPPNNTSTEAHGNPDVAFVGANRDIAASVWSNALTSPAGLQTDILLRFNNVVSVVNTTTAGNQETPAIGALPSGGFIVVWTNNDGTNRDIRAQEFSPTGQPVGGEINVSGSVGIGAEPKVAVNADGRALISWTQSGPGFSSQDIVGRLFDTRPAPTVPFTGGNDTINGTAGPDVVFGGTGSDRILPGGGNDTVDGGDGLDTVVVAGNRGGTTISVGPLGTVIADASGGTDLVSNVERVRFNDGTLATDTALPGLGESNVGSAYRLYKAAFNRTPDDPGLAFWIKNLDAGLTTLQAAGFFVSSDEFIRTYGADPAAAQLVTTFYTNILGRAPEQGGFDFWFNILNGRPDLRPTVLEGISNSIENQNGLIGTIGQGVFLPGDLLL